MKLIIRLLLIIFPCAMMAQEISLTKIKIDSSDTIIKRFKVYDCSYEVEKGNKLKTVTVKKGKDKTYTIEKEEVLSKKTNIPIEKEIVIEMTGFDGKASVFSKEDQPGKLFVDYWLNPLNTVPNATNIVVTKYALQCPKDLKNINYKDFRQVDSISRKLSDSEQYYLERISEEKFKKYNKNRSTSPDWFKYTNKIIKVYKYPKGTKKEAKTDSNDLTFDPLATEIDYVLVNKYDRNTIYELKLENRQVIDGISSSWDVGPLTLPFKYRFGFEEDGMKVDQQFEADINIGVFAGYKLYSWGYRKEQGRHLKLPESSLNIGAFFSLSAIELDASNTSVGENPIVGDATSSIGTYATGLGLIFNIKGLNIGAFGGIESAFGARASDWNYQNRLWLGLGIGYDLNNFKKSE